MNGWISAGLVTGGAMLGVGGTYIGIVVYLSRRRP